MALLPTRAAKEKLMLEAHNYKRNFNESEMKEKARRKGGLAMIGQTKLKVNLAATNMLQALECTTNKLTYIRCVIQAVR